MKSLRPLIVAAMLCFMTAIGANAEPDQPTQTLFTTLMSATISNDHEAFVAVSNATMAAALTEAALEAVSAQLKPRAESGYESTYLGEMEKQGHRVHLWRLRFNDGGDDALVTLSVKDGKAGGFYIQ